MRAASKRFINRRKLIETSEVLALAPLPDGPGPGPELPPSALQNAQPPVQPLLEADDELSVAQIMERLSSAELKRLISLSTLPVFLRYPAVAYNNYLQELGKSRELEDRIQQIKTEGKSNREILDAIVQMEYKDRDI